MGTFGFFKRPKPRGFGYTPRYYDPQKEELHERLAKYSTDMSEEQKAKERIKTGLRYKFYGDASYRQKQVNKSNFRLLYIMAILFFITYLILKSDRIIRIIESFSG